jgi:hypothetical protein
MADELVVVQTFLRRSQAEVARTALEAGGVPSMMATDDFGGVGPGVDVDEGVRLLVRAEDRERAEEILATDLRPEAARPHGGPAQE